MTFYVSEPISLESMNFPVGTILMYPFTTSIPNGWLLCNGSNYSQTQYPALYDAIGFTYGAGSAKLPDLIGRVPVGSGGENPGITGGATDVALTAAQTGMVAHRHINSDFSVTGANQCDTGSNDFAAYNDVNNGGTTGEAVKDGVTAPINGSTHTNLQPYMSMYFIIKVVP